MLTPKQKRFVECYLLDLNATAAYKAAYNVSDTVASASGTRLLGNVRIRAAICSAKEARSSRTQIDCDYVLRRLKENVERSMQAKPVLDKQGNPTGIYRYDGAVANAALKLLGEHIGFFDEQPDQAQVPKRAPQVFMIGGQRIEF